MAQAVHYPLGNMATKNKTTCTKVKCSTCKGDGMDPNATDRRWCSTCEGRGTAPAGIDPDTLVTVAGRLLALHAKIVAGELTDEQAVIALSDTTGLLVSDIQMYWRTHTLEDSPEHQRLYATIKSPLRS